MANTNNTARRTPLGTAEWAHVFKPNTKFNPDGVYQIDLLLSATEAQPLIEAFEKMVEEARAEFIAKEKDKAKAAKIKTYQVHLPCDEEVDEDGNPTGEYRFKFKANAVYKEDGKAPVALSIPVVDAKKQAFTQEIGNGSKVKIAYAPSPYCIHATKTVGVSLRLKAVQVLDLVKRGSSGVNAFDEEDGYEAEASQPEESEQSGDSTEAPKNNPDF